MRRVLVSVFSILLILPIVGQAAAKPPRERRGDMERLGLRPGQKERLRGVFRSSGAESDRASLALSGGRRQLFALYDDYRLNEGRARETIDRINRLQLDLLNASLERQLALRKQLSPEQFERLGKKAGPDGPGFGGPPGFDGPPQARDLPRLEFDSGQREAVERLWRRGSKEREAAFDAMSNDLRAIDRLYDDYRLDERAARRLIDSINKSQLRIMLIRLDWQVEIRKILSPQQFRALTRRPPPSRVPFMRRHGRPEHRGHAPEIPLDGPA